LHIVSIESNVLLNLVLAYERVEQCCAHSRLSLARTVISVGVAESRNS